MRRVRLQASRLHRPSPPLGVRRLAGALEVRLVSALSRRPLAFAAVAAMAAVSVAFGLHGLAGPLRTDFVAMLTGARVLGHGGCLYCVGAQAQAQAALLGAPPGVLDPFLETPVVALAYRPLLDLPPSAGFAVFLVLSAACVGVAGVLIWRRLGLGARGAAGAALLALTLVSLPAAWNYQLGQVDGLLVLFAAAGAVMLASGRRWGAGLLLSLLLLKPQTVWLLPFALLLIGEWRVVAGMAIGGACLGAASLGLVGPPGIGQWLSLLGARGPALATSDGLPGAIASLAGNGAGFAAAAVLGVAACAWVWSRRRSLTTRPLDVLALGVAVSLLFAPHVYGYDLIMVAVPLAILARRSLPAALLAALLLNATYLVDTYFIYAGPHLEALALCVIVALLAVEAGVRAPDAPLRAGPAQLSVPSSTTTGA